MYPLLIAAVWIVYLRPSQTLPKQSIKQVARTTRIGLTPFTNTEMLFYQEQTQYRGQNKVIPGVYLNHNVISCLPPHWCYCASCSYPVALENGHSSDFVDRVTQPITARQDIYSFRPWPSVECPSSAMIYGFHLEH